MFFAVLLVLEKQGLSVFMRKHSIFSHIYVILCVTVSFVIFNAASICDALESLKIMFTGGDLPLVSKEFLYYLKSYGLTPVSYTHLDVYKRQAYCAKTILAKTAGSN